jgi:hypothetical protein
LLGAFLAILVVFFGLFAADRAVAFDSPTTLRIPPSHRYDDRAISSVGAQSIDLTGLALDGVDTVDEEFSVRLPSGIVASAIPSLAVVATNTVDDVVLVRGGLNQPENFASGTGVVTHADGTLSDVSVFSGTSVEDAVRNSPIKNGQVGSASAGDVRRAGGTVDPTPTANWPNHCSIWAECVSAQ